ncbi:FliC/FljB family flagellin [Buttiauxella sp. A2-C2_NF]|uniref:FliC/FljB family flagellin n=1 Tax=Buttiauxella ferragutiae TaxID=82989 RepID=UPI001E351220|nr:FliC/FljB family flagellin [Buttiauxella ferragutiae]MCE0826850.1 FliC/FljB family flagellin [Buttiauxella ferragutiae]
MAQVINTNSLSLITQNNINKNQSALSTSIERLSSGLRINSAKDDAAGQAIANRFTSNIKGLTQAARNANDGISVAQTTEGALSEINNNLQRVRELTVQASTGTNSTSDLSSIQDEIKSRLSEIDRVSGQTQFNGVNVLAKDGKMNIQVGANDGEVITIDLKKIDSKTLGLDSFNVNGPVDSKGTLGTVKVSNFSAYYGSTTSITKATVAEKAPDDLATRLGVDTASVVLKPDEVYKDDNGNLFAKVTITPGSAAEVNNLKANGFDSTYDAVAGAGVAKDYYIALDPQSADTAKTAATAEFTIDTSSLSLSNLTTGSSSNPLDKLDQAIASVDKFRSSLGAIQNRLDSAVTNLNNTTTNLSEAQSRIQDADYATEVSNMSKAQIIQQAGNSVLAKSNQVPQQVLSLLQG